MKVLVANLGSTSFKYRLFDMTDERQLARGGVERIGSSESQCFVEIAGRRSELITQAPDHAAAVKLCLQQLTDPESGCLKQADEVAAIGFKAVHGGRISGVQRVTPEVLAAMEEMSLAAPAHNPPYIAAMRLLGEQLPDIPLVAAFETGFHATIPEARKRYAIPTEWADKYQVKRWGFHGASHRFIAERTAELAQRDDLKVISCHLGGSSSLTAIDSRKSVGTTMGMSPQSGLPQNNRVGDFDIYSLPLLMQATGKTLEETLETLASQGGLYGLSGGLSSDMRDLEQAAGEGNQLAQLALDVYVSEIRRYLGGLLIELGRLDWLVFTGGIGENGAEIRESVCRNLADFGIELDQAANQEKSSGERKISTPGSRVEIWVVPTNEEIVVARQTQQCLTG
ncbi:acetate/propionate family kinase [Lignipirellula cremea]|uniref:Acetate kinase n=1 Tax=Lignipirellula cremea TaxID=2528010 RepID=A0A518DMS8_9BACT|nr:acetate/propionate family kinase [Lignipirellula cremea]QDU93121.1 Acetate kinase [Lignipirellula cremea]